METITSRICVPRKTRTRHVVKMFVIVDKFCDCIKFRQAHQDSRRFIWLYVFRTHLFGECSISLIRFSKCPISLILHSVYIRLGKCFISLILHSVLVNVPYL